MKVIAIIDDKTIRDALKYSKASTITEALKVALEEYISLQKLKELGKKIKKDPLKFQYSTDEIRKINRQK